MSWVHISNPFLICDFSSFCIRGYDRIHLFFIREIQHVFSHKLCDSQKYPIKTCIDTMNIRLWESAQAAQWTLAGSLIYLKRSLCITHFFYNYSSIITKVGTYGP